MVNVSFNRDRALAVIACLERGEPVSPAGERWTRDDLLALAGVCFAAAMSHGPEGLAGKDPMSIPLEHREAYLQTLGDDLAWAIRWLAEMARLSMVGGYDALFDPIHVVRVDGSAPRVLPVSGVKQEVFAPGA